MITSLNLFRKFGIVSLKAPSRAAKHNTEFPVSESTDRLPVLLQFHQLFPLLSWSLVYHIYAYISGQIFHKAGYPIFGEKSFIIPFSSINLEQSSLLSITCRITSFNILLNSLLASFAHWFLLLFFLFHRSPTILPHPLAIFEIIFKNSFALWIHRCSSITLFLPFPLLPVIFPHLAVPDSARKIPSRAKSNNIISSPSTNFFF